MSEVKQKIRTITYFVPVREYVIGCPKCKHEFILKAVVHGFNDYTYEEEDKVYDQDRSYFCPYCGSKFLFDNESRKEKSK